MRSVAALSGDLPATAIVKILGLERTPHGGWRRETFCERSTDSAGRPASAAGYHLLEIGDVLPWRRLDVTQIWHWCAGAPLSLSSSADGVTAQAQQLGPNLSQGQRPQAVVPAQCWQTAESLGAWTLLTDVTAPCAAVSGLEMAPADWFPSPAGPPAGRS